MSLRWDQGRGTIEDMLAAGALEQVPDSREHADLLIAQAREHLASAKAIADSEPEGGYAMVYDAARKWLSAVLENQGLRTTSLQTPPGGLRRRLRAARATDGQGPASVQAHEAEPRVSGVPKHDEPTLTTQDVLEDCAKCADTSDDLHEGACPGHVLVRRP